MNNKIDKKFIPPFRIGRKRKRAILDAKGLQVVVFPQGLELMAQGYCEYLNYFNK